LNLNDRVQGVVGSMDNLQFDNGTLDLIWCEGAIYNIGFEKGLREWRRFLKTDGFVAVSEATWFTDERPTEIEEFWMGAYPGIDTLANKVDQMQKAGYVPVAAFILPDTCWTEHYYDTQAKAKELFLAKHAGDPNAEGFMANQMHEEKLYRKYSQYYGYAFFIGRKI
jgi:SAM-dependent methyltransferase